MPLCSHYTTTAVWAEVISSFRSTLIRTLEAIISRSQATHYMTATLGADVLQDELAVSLARAVAAANRRARESGVDLATSVVSISERSPAEGAVWRISYGPKDYLARRGGDLIVEVDRNDGSIKQVLHGQ